MLIRPCVVFTPTRLPGLRGVEDRARRLGADRGRRERHRRRRRRSRARAAGRRGRSRRRSAPDRRASCSRGGMSRSTQPANSDRLALPRITAPASRSLWVTAASCSGIDALERDRAGRRRRVGGADVVLQQHRDAVQRPADVTGLALLVERLGLGTGLLAQLANRVQQRARTCRTRRCARGRRRPARRSSAARAAIAAWRSGIVAVCRSMPPHEAPALRRPTQPGPPRRSPSPRAARRRPRRAIRRPLTRC